MSEDVGTLKRLHRALINLNKRAERSSNEILVSNFVDSEPLFDVLATHNNQIIYGRRGTGKTHALKYLAETVERRGDHAIYIDLRSIGSNSSIYSDTSRSLSDRGTTLIVDVLTALYDELYTIALAAIELTPHPEQLTARVDDLAAAITTVKSQARSSKRRKRDPTTEGRRPSCRQGCVHRSPLCLRFSTQHHQTRIDAIRVA